jgi:HAD superfamily hydrolase (TIGR01549 family)
MSAGEPAAILATLMFRAVIFDLFDTLVDLDMKGLPQVEALGRRFPSTHQVVHAVLRSEVPVEFENFARAVREVDLELRNPRNAEGIELPTVERFTAVLDRLEISGDGLAERLTEAHMGQIRSVARAVPHHPATLQRLRTGVRLGICSNFSHTPCAREVMQEVGILDLMDSVVISHDVGLRKPRPEIFEAVLNELDVHPEETLHVGDRLEADVEGAARCGITSVWITRRVEDPQAALGRYRGPPPVHVIRDLVELEPIVSGEV